MTDTSKDAVDRLVLAMIRSGNTTAANMLTALAVERDAANARADAAERENEAYRAMHLATVAERAENGGNPVTAQMRLRKAEEAARDAALVEAADIILADNYDDPDDAADAIIALRDKPAETAPQPGLCGTSEPQPARVVTVQDQIEGVLAKMGRAAASTEGSWATKGATISAASVWEWINELRTIAGGGDE